MNKELIDFLAKKKVICKSFEAISLKELGSRKKAELFFGVNLEDYYCFVFVVEKKSRFLTKDANEFLELHLRVEKYKDTTIKKKYILVKAPLCSKAKALLEENSWIVWNSSN